MALKQFWVVLSNGQTDEAWEFIKLFSDSIQAEEYANKSGHKYFVKPEYVQGDYEYPNVVYIGSRLNKSYDLPDFVGLFGSRTFAESQIRLKWGAKVKTIVDTAIPDVQVANEQ